MSKFFEYCARCRKTFVSESAWADHVATHGQKKNVIAKANAKDKPVEKKAERNVPTGMDAAEFEDMRLAAAKDLREKKKQLKAVGFECQTMTAAETETLYKKAVADGLLNAE